MGVITDLLAMIFGGGRNALKETVEVFRENAEAGAERAAGAQSAAMTQFAAEFGRDRRGRFDRFVDGINRLPRPALAFGTLGLFVSAMCAPLWFAERMQGLALVPEPLWWLLGVIVSFYFGARYQAKSADLQKSLVTTMAAVPRVIDNVAKIRALRFDSPGVADTGVDAEATLAALGSSENAALADWHRLRSAGGH